MREQQMISAFAEATVENTKDGIMMGLHPGHIANILTLAAFRLIEDFAGRDAALEGMALALQSLRDKANG